MRASPPIEVVLNRFGWWRGAVIGLALATGAVLATWIVSSRDLQPIAVILAAAVAGFALAAGGLSVARMRSTRLRWDGRFWQVSGADGVREPLVGNLQVAVDLGAWMLLRFVAEAPREGRRVVWLPAQRRGLEAQWHALRCAVYAPPPAPEAR